MFHLKKLLFLVILFFSIIKAGYPDIYIEEKITAIAGGNKTQGIKKTYITKNKTLLYDPSCSVKVIFDYNKNKVYSINDSGKDISVYPIEKFMLPVNADFYSDLTSLKESDLYIKESGKKRQIENYKCFEIVIYIPRIAAMMNIWLSSIESSLTTHFVFLERHSSILQKKILPVMRDKNACIIESTIVIVRPKKPEKYLKSELSKISNQDIPESVFSLPEDYRILNFN